MPQQLSSVFWQQILRCMLLVFECESLPGVVAVLCLTPNALCTAACARKQYIILEQSAH
jgi:hypothetical protein